MAPPKKPKKPIGKLNYKWSRLTLNDWRSIPVRVQWVDSLFKDPTFLEFLAMLHNESSLRKSSMALNEWAIALELGRIDGRRDLLDWIEMAARPQEDIIPITDVTYGIKPED